ncbi:hypothetical protein J5Z91_003484 [Salmonella enterica subsp. enterica serovar Infantis]|nr:hypothetical protein [Salmonella enterica subsp. enterica serovar Infantis]
MPAFEWVHVQLHQQKGMISLSPPTICNSAILLKSMFRMPMIIAFLTVILGMAILMGYLTQFLF